MKMKSMALIGLGMFGTLAIEKYGMPMMKKAKKTMLKKLDMVEKEIDQMM